MVVVYNVIAMVCMVIPSPYNIMVGYSVIIHIHPILLI